MLYWPLAFNTIVIMLFWLMNVRCAGPCPDDILGEVLTCLKNLTHESENDALTLTTDVERMKYNCNYGAFQESVRCLRDIYSSCEDPQKRESLRKYGDPDAWESGFNRLCSQINLYSEKKECIGTMDKDITNCIDKNLKLFTNKPDTVESFDGYSFDKNQEEPTKKLCRFFYWTTYCLQQPVGVQCGQDVRAIILDFTGGITPPVCRGYQIKNISSRTSRNSNVLTYISVLASLAVLLAL